MASHPESTFTDKRRQPPGVCHDGRMTLAIIAAVTGWAVAVALLLALVAGGARAPY